MQLIINDALQRVRQCGKAPGILVTQPERVQSCIHHGALFVAVGMDMLLLRSGADALAARFKPQQDCAGRQVRPCIGAGWPGSFAHVLHA